MSPEFPAFLVVPLDCVTGSSQWSATSSGQWFPSGQWSDTLLSCVTSCVRQWRANLSLFSLISFNRDHRIMCWDGRVTGWKQNGSWTTTWRTASLEIVQPVSDLSESITISLHFFKPLSLPSLTALAGSVNYPDEYKGSGSAGIGRSKNILRNKNCRRPRLVLEVRNKNKRIMTLSC